MNNNIVKNILKAIATTAMAAAIFIGTGKEAKAVTREEFAAMKGVSVEEVSRGTDLYYEYMDLKVQEAGGVDALLNNIAATDIAAAETDMLALVNADRAACGVGALAWDDELAVYAKQRAVEVMNNFRSAEYAAAYANGGDWYAVVHSGCREETGENAVMSYGSAKEISVYDKAFIDSASHHATRTMSGITKYAAASYTDVFTGDTVLVELFEYGTAVSFDYLRYAAEYPDLAAAFGQDRNALYNHYLSNGRIEGRKAYYTDGTLIG